MWDYKKLLTSFRLRKRLLAIADSFIIVVAGFFVNLPLPLFADRIGRPELFSYVLLTVFSCFACLLFFGAYNKLWRYFSKRDYLSCVKGVVFGFIISGVIHYLMMGDSLWAIASIRSPAPPLPSVTAPGGSTRASARCTTAA